MHQVIHLSSVCHIWHISQRDMYQFYYWCTKYYLHHECTKSYIAHILVICNHFSRVGKFSSTMGKILYVFLFYRMFLIIPHPTPRYIKALHCKYIYASLCKYNKLNIMQWKKNIVKQWRGNNRQTWYMSSSEIYLITKDFWVHLDIWFPS